MTGFHSVIDNPDSVSRVAPPTKTMASTIAATAKSHSRIARACWSEICPVMTGHLSQARGPYSAAPCPRNRRYAAPSIAPAILPAMPIRLRKLLGTLALLVLVVVWALVAMALAQAPAI